MKTICALLFVSGFLLLSNGYSKFADLEKSYGLADHMDSRWNFPRQRTKMWPTQMKSREHDYVRSWFHRLDDGAMNTMSFYEDPNIGRSIAPAKEWRQSEEEFPHPQSLTKMFGDEGEQRIVGGRDVFDGEIPWQVSLQRKSMNSGRIFHICGGSIINENWVVTAAHCVALALLSNYRVVSGTTNLRDENRIKNLDSSDYVIHKVVDVHIHDEYDMFRFRNDIALLKVDPPFSFNNKIKSIALPSSGHQAYGEAYASGWGLMQEGVRVTPSKLQTVSLPIVSDAECRQAYGDNLADTMICAGYKEGGKSVCQGDSGGPLFQKSGGQEVLIGVVSWGVGCARPGKPGVYTEVSHYIDWIDRIVGGGGDFRKHSGRNVL